ncbi:MAG: STM4011 family radical SAM protein [Pirellulaceae bacterium]
MAIPTQSSSARCFLYTLGRGARGKSYQRSIVRLSHYEHVVRVAIQTNLSANLYWLERANLQAVALWCTYHPDEVRLEQFLDQCQTLDRLGVLYSVGAVGLEEHVDAIESLRAELREDVYLWINAYKSSPQAISSENVTRLIAVDPLYPINAKRHSSFGRVCDTGLTTVSVDGDGNVRRCHFVSEVLGNIYQDELDRLLQPRRCPNASCSCHIGYVHMPELNLQERFGQNILERIPENK